MNRELFMKSPDKLLNLRDAALEDEVAVVGFTSGDVSGDWGEHEFAHLFRVAGLPQSPAQFDIGNLGQQVFAGHDTHAHQVAAGIVNEHMHKAPEGLHGHINLHAFGNRALDSWIDWLVDVAQSGTGDHDTLVAILGEGIDDVRMHVWIVINDGYPLFEEGQHSHFFIRAAFVIIRLYRDHGIPGDAGNRNFADGAESAAIGGVHLTHPGALMQQSIFIAGGAEHAYHHLGDVGMTGGEGRVHQIERRIRGRPVA